LTDCRRFVAAKIVHDDDVNWLKEGNQLLFDIGAKALAVDRSVEDARCFDPIFPKAPRNVSMRRCPCGANTRSRLPLGPKPLMGVMLVSSIEDQSFRIEVML
jgi:hypothetical protein